MVFATHGLPRKVVTDNGSSFTCEEFCTSINVRERHNSRHYSYQHSSNGLAERAGQTVKSELKTTKGDSLHEWLSKFLFTYCITLHTTMGIAPAQLLINCQPRSCFDHLFQTYNMFRRSRLNRQLPTTTASHYRASRSEISSTLKISPLPL